MGIVFLGPPGVGKGTQCRRLAEHLGAAHISTGEILRQAVEDKTPIGERVAGILSAGKLVGDDLMIEIVSERLAQPDAAARFLLDGYPRTIVQAESLDKFLCGLDRQISNAILLVADDAEIQRRLLERAVREDRSDDTPETVAQRLAVYVRRTRPLVGYYEQQNKLRRVDGMGSVDEVFERICRALPSSDHAAD